MHQLLSMILWKVIYNCIHWMNVTLVSGRHVLVNNVAAKSNTSFEELHNLYSRHPQSRSWLKVGGLDRRTFFLFHLFENISMGSFCCVYVRTWSPKLDTFLPRNLSVFVSLLVSTALHQHSCFKSAPSTSATRNLRYPISKLDMTDIWLRLAGFAGAAGEAEALPIFL